MYAPRPYDETYSSISSTDDERDYTSTSSQWASPRPTATRKVARPKAAATKRSDLDPEESLPPPPRARKRSPPSDNQRPPKATSTGNARQSAPVISNVPRPGTMPAVRCKFCTKSLLRNTGSFKFSSSCECVSCPDCYVRIMGLCIHCSEHDDGDTESSPYNTTSTQNPDDINICASVNTSVLYASTKFDIDTRSLGHQDQLVACFNKMMALCLENASMTIPEAFHTEFRNSVIADIQARVSIDILYTVGIDTLRDLDIPLELWKKSGYTVTMLAEIGYELRDFKAWDAKTPFTSGQVRDLREMGIALEPDSPVVSSKYGGGSDDSD